MGTNPEAAPPGRTAPVSPSAITRELVVKAARAGRVERIAGRTAFTRD